MANSKIFTCRKVCMQTFSSDVQGAVGSIKSPIRTLLMCSGVLIYDRREFFFFITICKCSSLFIYFKHFDRNVVLKSPRNQIQREQKILKGMFAYVHGKLVWWNFSSFTRERGFTNVS